MVKHMIRRSLLALALGLSPALNAQSPEAALDQFLKATQSVEAHFVQRQTDERGRAMGNSEGEMQLQRPGGFRWAVAGKDGQLIVTNGQSLWLYDPDLRQVTIRPADTALQGTPAALLLQGKGLKDTFSVQSAPADASAPNDVARLRLLPKQASNDFAHVDLWLKMGVPVRMTFADQLGGTTDIQFSQIRTNQAQPAARFVFTVPKGVEVVDERNG